MADTTNDDNNMNEEQVVGVDDTLDLEKGGGNAARTPATIELPEDPVLRGGFLKPIPETTPMERLAGCVAALAVGTALAAIIIEQSTVVIIGGVLSAIVGPYAYWQQTRLTDIRALQETQSVIKNQVDQLQEENEQLSNSVNELRETVTRMSDIEQAMDVLSQLQGQSIDVFSTQVEQNKVLLKQMQSNLKANVMQNLLNLLLRSDKDGDLLVSEKELEDVIQNIGSMAGVKLNEDRFKLAVKGKSVKSVMEVIRNLLDETVPQTEKIFELSQ